MATAESAVDGAYKCKLCSTEFDSVAAVLRHELTHMLSALPTGETIKTGTKRRRNGGKTNARKRHRKAPKMMTVGVNEVFAEMEEEVRANLLSCDEGSELNVLCQIFQPNPNYLSTVYNRVVADLEFALGNSNGGWNIQVFGSTITGMAMKDSDIDFYICPNMRSLPFRQMFNRVSKALQSNNIFSKVLPIRGARVPIIKCTHEPTGVNLDINMSTAFGVHCSGFISKLFQFDQRIHPFMLIMKIWAKSWSITRNGRMTNYTLILLVIFYLQSGQTPILPPLKNFRQGTPPLIADTVNFAYNEAIPNRTKNRSNIRNLLSGFFQFYWSFDFATNVICPYLGKAISRQDFAPGMSPFPEYPKYMEKIAAREEELKVTGELDWHRDVRSIPLDLSSAMVVQDPFFFNSNTAKAVNRQLLEQFKRMVTYDMEICNQQNNTPAQLLLRLFYEPPPANGVTNDESNSVPVPKQIVETCRLSPIETELFFVRMYLRKLHPTKVHSKQDVDRTWTEYTINFIKKTFTDIYKFEFVPINGMGKNDKFHFNGEIQGFIDTWQQRKCETKKNYAIFLQEQIQFVETAVKNHTRNTRIIHCRVHVDADNSNNTGINVVMHLIPPVPKSMLVTFFKDFVIRVRPVIKAYFEKLAMET